jgi:hypothetical protein
MTDAPAYYTGTMNIARNADWIKPFVYSYCDDFGNPTTGVPLGGSTLKLQIRRVEEEHEAIITVSSADPPGGITIEDAANGKFTIRITRLMLKRLPPGAYVSDLVRYIASNGYQERILSLDVNCVQGTSR